MHPAWRRRYREVLPFEEAKKCVRAIGFESKMEWDEWKNKCLGSYMPHNPDELYAEEWQGWDDFLGTVKFLDFKSARQVVAGLGLQNQEEWYNFVDTNQACLGALCLPERPRSYYKEQWQGYEHWLSLPESTLYFPRELMMRSQDGCGRLLDAIQAQAAREQEKTVARDLTDWEAWAKGDPSENGSAGEPPEEF